jgi:hypothetical protein|tara:strand:+ start:711 stop:965 length:255 start_codon:yes stop_codon:yes gene_type:complete
MDVLKKSDKPLSRTQIAEILNATAVSVSDTLRRLLKFEDIKCIELDRYQAAKLLGWSTSWRRTRFYYCLSISESKDFPSLAKGK